MALATCEFIWLKHLLRRQVFFFFFFIGKKQYIDQKKCKEAPEEYTRGIQKGT